MLKHLLTTAAACRVAGIHRDRFNEHVAAGHFRCAPKTVPGRARLFDPDDMVALCLFVQLAEDGFDAQTSGFIACQVAEAARRHPDARAITFVQDYFKPVGGHAFPADQVPLPSQWDDVLFGGTDIRKTTTFRIGKLREMIAHRVEQERAIVGEPD